MRRVRVPRQGITNLRDKGHRVVEIGRIERERKRWGHEGEEKRRKERMHSLKPPCKYLLVERVASRKNSLYLPLSLSLSLPLVSSFSTPLSLFVSLSLSLPLPLSTTVCDALPITLSLPLHRCFETLSPSFSIEVPQVSRIVYPPERSAWGRRELVAARGPRCSAIFLKQTSNTQPFIIIIPRVRDVLLGRESVSRSPYSAYGSASFFLFFFRLWRWYCGRFVSWIAQGDCLMVLLK